MGIKIFDHLLCHGTFLRKPLKKLNEFIKKAEITNDAEEKALSINRQGHFEFHMRL